MGKKGKKIKVICSETRKRRNGWLLSCERLHRRVHPQNKSRQGGEDVRYHSRAKEEDALGNRWGMLMRKWSRAGSICEMWSSLYETKVARDEMVCFARRGVLMGEALREPRKKDGHAVPCMDGV